MKTYLSIPRDSGFPRAEDVFFECLRCGDILPSMPDDDCGCTCRNMVIDVAYGRLAIEDRNQFRAYIEAG